METYRYTGKTILETPFEYEIPDVFIEMRILNRHLTTLTTHDQKIGFLENYISYCVGEINKAAAAGKSRLGCRFEACKVAARRIWNREIEKEKGLRESGRH
jgi:hypothetical protein